jgi:CheY-like chemotaxis protein
VKKILVVDDEYVVLDALSMLLEGEGFHVRKASNGAEAFTRLEEEVPDVIVCDAQMPVLDGPALMRRMQGEPRFASIPVVLMIEAFGKSMAGSELASAVLTKPVRFEDLLDLLTRVGDER